MPAQDRSDSKYPRESTMLLARLQIWPRLQGPERSGNFLPGFWTQAHDGCRHFPADLGHEIPAEDARTAQPIDKTIEDSWRRVARRARRGRSRRRRAAVGRALLRGAGGFPASCRPAASWPAPAPTARVTLFNCFVMGTIPDDMGGIFDHLREAALTMQQGGGIGYDFSTLRPRGAPVKGVGADASGPLSFMDVWDAMCRTIMSAGHRRGAMMATLRCDHPDIEAFIEAKRDAGRLRMFNLSVLVDRRLHDGGASEDAPWELTFGGTTYRRAARARAVGQDHARDLRLCRARRDLHRPHQPAEQPRTTARRSARPIPAASSRCRPMAPACWARSIWRGWCSDPFEPTARTRHDGAGRSGARSPCA